MGMNCLGFSARKCKIGSAGEGRGDSIGEVELTPKAAAETDATKPALAKFRGPFGLRFRKAKSRPTIDGLPSRTGSRRLRGGAEREPEHRRLAMEARSNIKDEHAPPETSSALDTGIR
jgi:hypothetical protein